MQATAPWRGWTVCNERGKVRIKLQFLPGAGIANASASLPYEWADSSRQPVSRLLDEIYGPVMEKGVTLKAAIADALAISDHKSQEVVTPWPGIVAAFRELKRTTRRNLVQHCDSFKDKDRKALRTLRSLEGKQLLESKAETTDSGTEIAFKPTE